MPQHWHGNHARVLCASVYGKDTTTWPHATGLCTQLSGLPMALRLHQHMQMLAKCPQVPQAISTACLCHVFVYVGPAACKSTVSRGSKASRSSATTQAAAASTSGQAPTMTSSSLLISPITATGGTSSRSPGQRRPCDLPGKPCSTPLSPIDIITASRQAKAAAVANARVKPAIFVLPVGAPGEPDEPRVPQGKGKATAAEDQARQQVS